MGMSWVVYALLSTLFFSGMILLFKMILAQGIKPSILMLFISICLTFFYFIHVALTRDSPKVNYWVLILLVVAGFLSYAGNLFYTKSIEIAPNPGYSAAIISLQLVIITLTSFFIFGSEISFVKLTGIILAMVAGALL